MKRLVTLLILVGIGLLLAKNGGYFEEHYGFQKESAHILRLLTSGTEGAKEAYEGSSILLRESRLLSSDVDKAERLTKTLGAFQKIESVEEIEVHNSIHGKTARIVYELRFGNGIVTPGELSFLRGGDGKWRLLGYDIRVPMMLRSRVLLINSETKRIVAPAKVRRLLVTILEDTVRGLGDKIYEEASPPFRESSSKVQFQKTLAGIDEELGAFEHVLEFTKSDHNAGKTRAKLTAILQYENARTTGTFEFIKVENEQEWRLLRFKVTIPAPLLPAQAQPPSRQ
ncbi:MAG: hypothetical protein GY811_20395 [Myxococcales bacterium]|nr:hypothetical protein [Myxococcales bacterium]